MIPFLYTFTGEERDRNFADKHLIPELPGILRWAVEGCRKWQEEGIKVPQKAMAAMEEYRDEMDIVQRFLEERCITGDMYTTRVGDLYQHFCSWCQKSGDRAVSNIKFGRKLKEKGFVQYKSNGWPHWKGIGVFSIR
jgi:putative DNA primase/helicase